MNKRPPNHQIGQQNSLKVRRAKAQDRNAETWWWIQTVAVLGSADNLEAIAYFLNRFRVETARGGEWTPGLVQHHLKKRGLTAKQLAAMAPADLDYAPDSSKLYRRWFDYFNAVEDEGEWLLATAHTVRKHDLIIHGVLGEGQAQAVYPNGWILASFVDEARHGSFQVCMMPSTLMVFRQARHRSIRQRLTSSFTRDIGIDSPSRFDAISPLRILHASHHGR
jgi:hypothetical protein